MMAKIKMTEKGLVAQSERRLHHSVEDVWAMLTDNDLLKKWFQELRVGDLREGGFMKFDIEDVLHEELEITELINLSVLEFDWFGDEVRFELHFAEYGCLLLFKEKVNLITEQTKKDLAGWHVCLDVIQALLDGKSILRETEWEKWHQEYVHVLDKFI
ncbi:SRPBCC domain-containing protein [Sporosarcina sp. G11-34]|nr:SRPBCC domain-containing protein [Sporosarcina sp. G11-34]